MDFAAFRTFWESAVNIAVFTATPASQHGYGMSATEDDTSTTLLTDAVNNFGVAYAATQESLRSNSATINAMQAQLQMLCNVIGNQPPLNMIQFHQPRVAGVAVGVGVGRARDLSRHLTRTANTPNLNGHEYFPNGNHMIPSHPQIVTE